MKRFQTIAASNIPQHPTTSRRFARWACRAPTPLVWLLVWCFCMAQMSPVLANPDWILCAMKVKGIKAALSRMHRLVSFVSVLCTFTLQHAVVLSCLRVVFHPRNPGIVNLDTKWVQKEIGSLVGWMCTEANGDTGNLWVLKCLHQAQLRAGQRAKLAHKRTMKSSSAVCAGKQFPGSIDSLSTKRELKLKRWSLANSPNLSIWKAGLTYHSNVRIGSLTLRCKTYVGVRDLTHWVRCDANFWQIETFQSL